MNTTADRIKEAMELRGLRQADLVEKTGISKGALSSYISGRYTPKQNNTYLIAKALDVNEAWLMGADVLMERDNYEDQNINAFEAKLNSAVKLLEDESYTVSFSDDPKDDIITIINSNHEPISCLHEYELVNKYESLQKKGRTSGKLLAETDIDLLEKRNARLKAYAEKWNLQFFEKKMLDSFTQLSDSNKKKSISYTENLLSNQKMEEELLANAAHDRTDTEFTEEERKADEDMLD